MVEGEAGERAEMRHAKTLVCNQVTGAVRIVLVCGQLLQPFESALQRLAHLRAHAHTHAHISVISDTAPTKTILLSHLCQRRIKEREENWTLGVSLCQTPPYIQLLICVSLLVCTQRG